jgi:hypothetical protein
MALEMIGPMPCHQVPTGFRILGERINFPAHSLDAIVEAASVLSRDWHIAMSRLPFAVARSIRAWLARARRVCRRSVSVLAGQPQHLSVWAMPRVINLHGLGGVLPEGAEYIGGRVNRRPWRLQGSKWANLIPPRRDATREEREASIRKYERHLYDSGLIHDVHELRGRDLACWCAPDRWRHLRRMTISDIWQIEILDRRADSEASRSAPGGEAAR